MHTTQSVDIGIVQSGEVWLELDDDQEVKLTAGDYVIQNGTRHAWHNRSNEPCVMNFVLIGADSKG
jgi:quercetin dioxygenase-like cupin family protein